MGYDKDDPRSHPEYYREVDLETVHDHMATVEVDEVRHSGDAANERGNPDVIVMVHSDGRIFERYRFEFVRPPSNEEYPYYRPGPYSHTKGAELAKRMNEAWHKAAKALAEHTDTAVHLCAYPQSRLDCLEGRRVDR